MSEEIPIPEFIGLLNSVTLRRFERWTRYHGGGKRTLEQWFEDLKEWYADGCPDVDEVL